MVDHPIALGFSILISAPFIWVVGTFFFRNIAEDAKEAAPYAFLTALTDQLFNSWLLVKLIYFSIITVVLIMFFYRIGAWFAEL